MARIVGLVFPVEATSVAPPIADSANEEKGKSTKPRKKADIQAYLDSLGIEYPDDATVDELKALMPDDD